jgi:hypothetical protein
MRLKEHNVHLRTLTIFFDYNKLLKDNGLEWLHEEHQKECVQHIVSAIRPAELQRRVRHDLTFSKKALKRDLEGL